MTFNFTTCPSTPAFSAATPDSLRVLPRTQLLHLLVSFEKMAQARRSGHRPRRLVQEKGLEPPLPLGNWILNPARLPNSATPALIISIRGNSPSFKSADCPRSSSCIMNLLHRLVRLRLRVASASSDTSTPLTLATQSPTSSFLRKDGEARRSRRRRRGGLHWTRTNNPQIKSLLLYQIELAAHEEFQCVHRHSTRSHMQRKE